MKIRWQYPVNVRPTQLWRCQKWNLFWLLKVALSSNLRYGGVISASMATWSTSLTILSSTFGWNPPWRTLLHETCMVSWMTQSYWKSTYLLISSHAVIKRKTDKRTKQCKLGTKKSTKCTTDKDFQKLYKENQLESKLTQLSTLHVVWCYSLDRRWQLVLPELC